jgi:hypothetical protein
MAAMRLTDVPPSVAPGARTDSIGIFPSITGVADPGSLSLPEVRQRLTTKEAATLFPLIPEATNEGALIRDMIVAQKQMGEAYCLEQLQILADARAAGRYERVPSPSKTDLERADRLRSTAGRDRQIWTQIDSGPRSELRIFTVDRALHPSLFNLQDQILALQSELHGLVVGYLQERSDVGIAELLALASAARSR